MLQRRIALNLVCLLLVVAGTAGVAGEEAETVTLVLPLGDPAAGREAFVTLSCSTCHRAETAKDLPPPTSKTPGPTLGRYQAQKTAAELGRSIFEPSHEISATVRGRDDGLSPMPDFTRTMTIRQYMDLIAFLKAQ